jgi:monoamine oxidase
LLTKLAANLPIRRSTPVHSIEWIKGLTVETDKGTLRAQAVIVTVSTSVLSRGKLKFTPELPERWRNAAAALSLGSYDHIALELPGNPLGLQADDLVFEKSSSNRTGALLARVSGTDLHVVSVGGDFGRDLSAQGRDTMVAFAGEWLASIFGSAIGTKIVRAAATQWDAEPWIMGASSAASVGNQDARRALMAPLRERVWFAGEAVHETLYGTVGGAWESGTRAAEAVLRKIGAIKPSETEKRHLKREPRRREHRPPRRRHK